MIAIGICLAILAAALGTTSKQLIAFSTHVNKKWIFHLGASINILVGPVVDASAYAFAPQVIVAPFACLDVIFNALVAPYTLSWQNEKLTRSHCVGTALVFTGAVCTSLFAQAGNIIYTVYELEEQLFFRPTSIAYLSIELASILLAESALRRKMLSPSVRGIALGVIAGVLMGNVFFMKGLIGIIQTTSKTSYDAWLRPTPYILIAFAAGGAVFGHIMMRKGLGEYKGVFMVTIFEGAHISAACLSGCVVMEEMAGAPWWRYILYWLSVSLIISGLLVINVRAAEAQMHAGAATEEKTRFHIAQSFADEEGGSERKRVDFPLDDLNGNGDDMDEVECVTIGHRRQNRNGVDNEDSDDGRAAQIRSSPRPVHSDVAPPAVKLADVALPPPPKVGALTSISSPGANVKELIDVNSPIGKELIDMNSPIGKDAARSPPSAI